MDPYKTLKTDMKLQHLVVYFLIRLLSFPGAALKLVYIPYSSAEKQCLLVFFQFY
jgi:hypothetical protein